MAVNAIWHTDALPFRRRLLAVVVRVELDEAASALLAGRAVGRLEPILLVLVLVLLPVYGFAVDERREVLELVFLFAAAAWGRGRGAVRSGRRRLLSGGEDDVRHVVAAGRGRTRRRA